MFRAVLMSGAAVLLAAGSASGGGWRISEPLLIDSNGVWPSLWEGTIAYLDGDGGAVMFYHGFSDHIYGPSSNGWEPANANGSIAWRNTTNGGTTSEIYLWAGQLPPENVSDSPGTSDSDLDAAGNGDLIWSEDHTWLMYYDASASTTTPLGVKGVHPSLYVTTQGVATYAYQDPDTDAVKYFDGGSTHTLGAGEPDGAHPSLWDGMVAWLGPGEGSTFVRAEVFLWHEGETTRLTDDDDEIPVPGIADNDPAVWNDVVIWSRRVNGPFMPPELVLWDGMHQVQLTTTGGNHPSFQGGQVSWEEDTGLYLADVLPIVADCNASGQVDLTDYVDFEVCLTRPGDLTPECECFDFDGGGRVDLADFAVFQQEFDGP